MAGNGCCKRLGLLWVLEQTRGREESKALKHSLPPPPPFCPRHQNKRADTRVPMTLVYYQDCTVHSSLGHVVQLVPPACRFPKVRGKIETTNPQSISGASFGLGPQVSAAIQSQALTLVIDTPSSPVNTAQKSIQARPSRRATAPPNGKGEG